MLARLTRKIREILRYPGLAWRREDRRELWLLGFMHCRVISRELAVRLSHDGSGVVHPRLDCAHGESIRVDLRDPEQVDTFNELFLDRIYDLELVPFQPDLVLDCGAFCGYFSAMATGVFPDARVVAFEPNPSNFAILEAQLACLRCPPTLIRAAVSDRDGEVEFSGSGMGGSIVARKPGTIRSVPCIDLPAWLRSQSTARLVWKLDVEGAEKLLLGACIALLPRQSVVFLETHYPDRDCKEMLQPYRTAGFVITEVRRRKALDGDYCYVEWLLVRDA